MMIIIKRRLVKDGSTDGELYVNSRKICDTAEATPYCLSPGSYTVRLTQSQQHGRKMPLLTPTEGYGKREAFITPGNGVFNLKDGTILVGTTIVSGCVKHSAPRFEQLYARMRMAIKRKQKIQLIIEKK